MVERRMSLLTVVLAFLVCGCGPSQPMKDAVLNGSVRDVRAHLKGGYAVNEPIKPSAGEESILHFAARRYAGMDRLEAQHEEILRWLIGAGADLNGRDKEQATPLHAACYHGGPRVVELLLECHADPNAVDRSGYTPLHWAAGKHHVDCCKLLVAHGANVNAQEKTGDAPLHYALRENNSDGYEVIKTTVDVLLDAGADINLRDEKGLPPLNHTSRTGRMAAYLKSRGAKGM